jgi:hypothetical protein
MAVLLIHPPGDNNRHVEAQDKGDRNQLGKGFAVEADLLEQLLKWFVYRDRVISFDLYYSIRLIIYSVFDFGSDFVDIFYFELGLSCEKIRHNFVWKSQTS